MSDRVVPRYGDAPAGRLPINSINFVTCHDGFTLRDLVSYETKHNEANGEANRDGADENLSCGYGVEGETEDPAINSVRRRQAKNFIAILLLSQGVPMLLAGDEVLRTQGGNNNTYAQDNPTGWLDWTLADANRAMLRFTREMIAFRRRHPSLMRRRFLSGQRRSGARSPDICWHGAHLFDPPWDDPDSQFLAFTLAGVAEGEEDLHVLLNMSQAALDAELPAVPDRVWYRAVDTWLESPGDILDPAAQPRVQGSTYPVHARSVVVLEARPSP